MKPDIVCDERRDVIFAYGGVRMIQTESRYEITENGVLLAVAKVSAVAERLFLYRALAIATDKLAEAPAQQAAFTPAGKQVYFLPESKEEGGDPEEEKPKREVFHKPTAEEICAYCEERGKGLDGQAIYDHYESNGWKVGRTKMKDWKAAVRTWERKDKERAAIAPAPKRSRVEAANPEHSSLDTAAMESALLGYRPKFRKPEEVST